MDRWQRLQNEISVWSDKTFGSQQEIDSLIEHVLEEIQELKDDPYNAISFADIFILLFKLAKVVGYNTDELYEACVAKHRINSTERVWLTDGQSGRRRYQVVE